MRRIDVVARSFQVGAGKGKDFNMEQFRIKVAERIQNCLLRFPEVVGRVIIVTNGDPESKLGEGMITGGITPTVAALQEVFSKEIADGIIVPHICTSWGANPGSGNALNEGLAISMKSNPSGKIMMWSPEIEMSGYRISDAMNFMSSHNLAVVGFLRDGWWERPQHMVPQNTAAIWDASLLHAVNGFAPECNGTGETVETKEYSAVLLAGMEDFHTMLRMMKQAGEFRWGMVGNKFTLEWDTNFEPGSERELNHLKKVARQYLVMQAYAGKVFPELAFSALMKRLFACGYRD